MSVILYSPEKFERIYLTLERFSPSDLAHLFHYPDKWQDGLGDTIKGWLFDLYRSNIACWNEQYEEHEKAELIDFQHSSFTPYKNQCELLKSLRGLRYNLFDNGGEEFSVNGSQKILSNLIEHIALSLVEMMPEYENAGDVW